MAIAARLRELRIRAGKSRDDVAEHLQLNVAWVQDLERRDDELASTLTLFQAMELASLLGTDLRALLGGDTAPVPHVPIIKLPTHIRAFLEQEDMSLADFETQVGWDVAPFLDAPLQEASELPLAFLQAVTERLGIPWFALIEDDEVG